MYQRHVRPSAGLIGRPLSHDISSIANASRRAFHITSSACEEKDPSSPAIPPTPQRDSRVARSSNAFAQLNSLPRKPTMTPIGGLRAGVFRSGQKPSTPPPAQLLQRRTPPARLPDGTLAPTAGASAAGAPKLLIRRLVNPNQQYRDDGPTSGAGFAPRGPRAPREGRERGERPRREGRGRKDRDDQKGRKRPEPELIDVADHLTDGDVLHLLRLQRAAWDPKPYEPIYSAESDAINSLVENGRKLIFGEEVEEKPWIRLTKKEKKALAEEKQRVAGGKYEISALGLAKGSKKEELWMGTALRGSQTNASFTTKDRDMFLGKLSGFMGIKAPLQATV
ncbi:uncharacterized protein BDZ99DRAFT_465450 [Mytilinidion resinicola]|uniref:Uncharacterized protein n=1 Tax=Mytilinidion resinicola TaxID=574789 RepID=A0A6A6YF18_9PEZI|nr:uncharacterized protein BDZ99DRAFT_465450 [Mytilinidion resinicola]KAF2806655.1 hypothetical protein BDZ99DRAFT_465450 [Mytilinidion resinicola]